MPHESCHIDRDLLSRTGMALRELGSGPASRATHVVADHRFRVSNSEIAATALAT